MAIMIKTPQEIEKMRRSGQVVREVLEHVRKFVKPGASTRDLENAAAAKIEALGAKPAFKGYRGYPCVLCTSVNEEVVHGIPSAKRVLKDGDIVSIDTGVIIDGFYGDSATTVAVGGKIPARTKKLLEVTETSLRRHSPGPASKLRASQISGRAPAPREPPARCAASSQFPAAS